MEFVCDPDSAKLAAKRLLQKYTYNKSEISHYEVSAMMKDIYSNINANYNPTPEDIKGFHRGLDANRDGRVTLEDLEAKAIKYLCGIEAINSKPLISQKRFTESVRNNLAVARRLFEQYQNPTDKTISEKEVPLLLKETYSIMGRQGYQPSSEDVRVWMDLCDSDHDGKVVYKQYEQFVIKSLERAGIQLYE